MDGEQYDGNWKDGKFSGQGIKIMPDGTVYDGSWDNGLPEGFGKCKFADTSVYEGDWENETELLCSHTRNDFAGHYGVGTKRTYTFRLTAAGR